jgi:hypothetical protein
MQARIEQAVDAVLEARGYRKVEENPDFRVGWLGAIEEKVDVDTINSYRGYSRGPWGYPQTYVREYEEGTVIIDIVDGRSGQLVWRGTGQAELSQSSNPEKRQERLQKVVEKILSRFPPKPRAAS